MFLSSNNVLILHEKPPICYYARWPGYVQYRKVSKIRRTAYQNLNDSRLIMQLSVPNPLKQSVKPIMKM